MELSSYAERFRAECPRCSAIQACVMAWDSVDEDAAATAVSVLNAETYLYEHMRGRWCPGHTQFQSQVRSVPAPNYQDTHPWTDIPPW